MNKQIIRHYIIYRYVHILYIYKFTVIFKKEVQLKSIMMLPRPIPRKNRFVVISAPIGAWK